MSGQSVIDGIKGLANDLERCRPWIEAALAYSSGPHTFDDVCVMIFMGKARLWATPNSCIITEVLDYPREKHYHIWLGGGDLKEMLALHKDVQQAAKEAGCCKLTVAGRRGWVKPLKEHGWKEYLTTLAKEVE